MNTPKIMTPEQFKTRWESDDDAGGITYDDIADCAKAWGLFSYPRLSQIDRVCYAVMNHAGTKDAEDFNPANNEHYES